MTLKLGVVITADELQQFSIVYFEKKSILFDNVTSEPFLSRVGTHREITQII